MKKITYYSLLIALVSLFSNTLCAQVPSLTLSGVMDFTIPSSMATVTNGSQGKAIEVAAIKDISDLSVYGLGVANNGGGTDGQEYTFPAISVNAGEHILIARDTAAIHSYFSSCFNNFDHVLLASSSISQNGDDAIELFKNANNIKYVIKEAWLKEEVNSETQILSIDNYGVKIHYLQKNKFRYF